MPMVVDILCGLDGDRIRMGQCGMFTGWISTGATIRCVGGSCEQSIHHSSHD